MLVPPEGGRQAVKALTYSHTLSRPDPLDEEKQSSLRRASSTLDRR